MELFAKTFVRTDTAYSRGFTFFGLYHTLSETVCALRRLLADFCRGYRLRETVIKTLFNDTDSGVRGSWTTRRVEIGRKPRRGVGRIFLLF